jgi:hypothetical protein
VQCRLAVLLFLLTVTMPVSAAKLYAFETLSEKVRPVQVDIRKALLATEAEEFQDCQRQIGFTNSQMEDYFTAIGIGLNAGKGQGLLVLPTKYCDAFFGAHAIAFWVFLTGPNNPRLVLTGRQDALEVSDSTVNGLANLTSYYGGTATHFVYNGKHYVVRRKR